MQFKTWLEYESSLNGNMPETYPPNRGTATPASDAVRRTGLQPQVDSHEIRTDEKDEQDKILAIDAILQRVDQDFPNGKNRKISKFKKLWSKLKSKWDDLKMNDDISQEVDTNGLGSATGNKDLINYMQNNPNALPSGPNQFSNFSSLQ